MAVEPGAVTRREAVLLGSAGAVVATVPAGAIAAPPSETELWYTRPATVWTEALPVGNGRIGAMVFGGIAEERLQLNEDTLWGGGPYDPVNPQAKASMAELRRLIFAGRYADAQAFATHVMGTPVRQTKYKSVGDLAITMTGIVAEHASDYRRSLDIDAAVAETHFTHGGVHYTRSVVASPLDQVIAVRVAADRHGAVSLRLGLTSPMKDAAVTITGRDTLVLAGRNDEDAGIPGALRFEARVRVVAEGGTVAADGAALSVTNANAVTLLIAMATSYRRFDDVSGDPTAITMRQIAAASRRTFARIAGDTAVDHRKLFRRVAIDLGAAPGRALPTDQRIVASVTRDDPGLAALYYQYARYLLISCSRPGGQAANLQGLWNDSNTPPWGSKFTININTEMNYWPAETTNLAECVEPLVRLVRDLSITGARTAQEMYGARGWVAHHNTDLWRATAPIDGAKYGIWPMGGAWLCTYLWDHYDFHRDAAFLASVYPLLRGACLFFLDTLQVDPGSGHLVTNPSLSPENDHGHGSSLIYGPTMDMEILRDLFDQTVAAAKILGTDPDLSAEIAAAREKLLPPKIGAAGQLQEWPFDWDMQATDIHHRHVSHLYGLFPSDQIDLDRTPDLAAAAKRSLEIRGDRATGWATAWRINLWARLRDGDHAHEILRFLLGPERTYPNLFDAHPPFQIDGNFGGTSGITEMLLQSQGGVIRLLPALPKAWPSGSIRGLRARGGHTVDIAWQGGRLVSAKIVATRAGTATVRYRDGSRTIILAPGRTIMLTDKLFTTAGST